MYNALADGGVRVSCPGRGVYPKDAAALIVWENATKKGKPLKKDFQHHTNSGYLAKQVGVLLGAKGHSEKRGDRLTSVTNHIVILSLRLCLESGRQRRKGHETAKGRRQRAGGPP